MATNQPNTTTVKPEAPCNCEDQEQCGDPTRNDFNEEQMSTDPTCGPVETTVVKPDDGEVKSGHIPGVAVS